MTKLLSTATYAAIMMVLLALAGGCTNESADAEPSRCTNCPALTVDPTPGEIPCAGACTESYECIVDETGNECTLADVAADVQCVCQPLEVEVPEEDCDDEVDNDGDGDVDCDDNDCDEDEACATPPAEVCDDTIDNDEDGLTDCDDNDCDEDEACATPPAEVCDDTIDNDEDGLTDCDDNDCDEDEACATPPVEVCDDGADNDEDGLTDCDDNDCDEDEACATPLPVEVCDDGVDNDGDGDVDVSDPDCAGETVAAIGVYLGVESVVHILTGDGQAWDGNIPGDFTLSIEIDGDDAWARVWVATSSFEVVGGGQGFTVFSPPYSVAPPAWPVADGLPVSNGGSFAATPDSTEWFDLYFAGATE